MQKKLTNEEKYRYLRYRLICYYMIIVTGILTIGLSLASLFLKISPIYAIICFVLEVVFSKLRVYFRDKEKGFSEIEDKKKEKGKEKK